MKYVIEVRNLEKKFGAFEAVKGISFRVRTGECLGLLGPNGAGKTSTIRMIYGYSPVTSGTLNIFGLDIRTKWRTIKSHIGVCQQENSLDPDLSVQQNLEVFARYFNIPKKDARERAERLLDFIALSRRRDDKVVELSGGMMRRLMLARALINNPRLLILDEPTTGLDPQSRHQVWERLEELRFKGLSILLTTHYMEEASHLCDRIIIVDHGKILTEGKAEELIRRHVGRNIIEITRPTPALRQYVQESRFTYEDLGHRLIVYEHDGIDLFLTIQKKYCNEKCTLRAATLEDVFLKLTGRELRE